MKCYNLENPENPKNLYQKYVSCSKSSNYKLLETVKSSILKHDSR